MAESRDDAKLAAHYRALATEEPSAVLDQAIRAAARRAVSSAPSRGASRWTVPVSIAAVLVLSFGVTLRMQQEEPGIESVAPAARAPEPVQAEVAREDVARPELPKAVGRAEQPAADSKDKKREAAPAVVAQPAPKVAAQPAPKITAQPAPQAEASRAQESIARPAAPAPGPVAAPPAPSPAAPPAARLAEPPPLAAAQAPQKPATSGFVPAPAAAPDAAQAARPRALQDSAPAGSMESNVAPGRRDEAAGAAAGFMAKRSKAADDPERELERIAELRRDGRDREADEALAKFRREHPDYTIKPEVWERVRAR